MDFDIDDLSYCETIPEILHRVEKRFKKQDKALKEGVELGIKIRANREDIIEQDYFELEKDPRAFLIKKALYYLEYDEGNREKYLRFIRDYFVPESRINLWDIEQ